MGLHEVRDHHPGSHRVLHADETPVQMLQPGKGATHRAYLWASTHRVPSKT
jgi:hypothetical protein